MVRKISLLSMVLILAGFLATAQNNTANIIQVSQNNNILQVSFILPSGVYLLVFKNTTKTISNKIMKH